MTLDRIVRGQTLSLCSQTEICFFDLFPPQRLEKYPRFYIAGTSVCRLLNIFLYDLGFYIVCRVLQQCKGLWVKQQRKAFSNGTSDSQSDGRGRTNGIGDECLYSSRSSLAPFIPIQENLQLLNSHNTVHHRRSEEFFSTA